MLVLETWPLHVLCDCIEALDHAIEVFRFFRVEVLTKQLDDVSKEIIGVVIHLLEANIVLKLSVVSFDEELQKTERVLDLVWLVLKLEFGLVFVLVLLFKLGLLVLEALVQL